MNYRQIEIFAAIMEHGSVTEAALHLHLSQPAVSKSLKALETELGLRLFQRIGGGLQATDEGQELYSEARRVLSGFTHLSNFAQNLSRLEHARLIIGAIPTLSLNWLPQAVASFSERYPDVTFVFHSRSSPQTVKLVAQGELDIGLSQMQTDDASVRRHKLLDLAALCALPARHRLASKPVIEPQDLQNETVISLGIADEFRRIFEAMLVMNGVQFRSRLEVGLGVTICSLVSAGCGIGIVDVESARMHRNPDIVYRRFAPEIKVPIYLTQSVRKPQNLAMQQFIDHLLRQAPRSLTEVTDLV